MRRIAPTLVLFALLAVSAPAPAADYPRPYDRHCTERENVFEFTKKPSVRLLAKDRYEITFAVKGYCDVTVDLADEKGVVVRHLASGVLGKNAPAPFQKDSLEQKIYWDGKDDLAVYVKEPEKLKLRVRLGLKPVFDKSLGGVSPYRIPMKRIFGMAAGSDAIYVLSASKGPCFYLRKFDRDGNYVASLVPPPANLPEEKLAGSGYVEYEPGKKALQAHAVNDSVSVGGNYLSDPGVRHAGVQPVVVDGRFYYVNSGAVVAPSMLLYVYTDGSTDLAGSQGQLMLDLDYKKNPLHAYGFLAASPDGRYVYLVPNSGAGATDVWRRTREGKEPAELFAGVRAKPGSDEKHLNGAMGIACDGKGRVYVCDQMNNRVQVFSPEGKPVKSLLVESPRLVKVHGKTGALYVLHKTRIKGKAYERVTVFNSLDNFTPRAVLEEDGEHMALDWRGDRPRLWLAGSTAKVAGGYSRALEEMESASKEYGDPSRGLAHSRIRMWEEVDGKFTKLADFDERAAKEDGPNAVMNWTGGCLGYRVACDPVSEKLYFSQSLKGFSLALVFDLATGKPLYWTKQPGATVDMIFDKRGYMHCHLNPLFCQQGVARVDTTEKQPHRDGSIAGLPLFTLKEVPYDYGIAGIKLKDFAGLLPTRCQPGAKSFQDGLGANMQGDVTVESNIYYVPKMEEAGYDAAWGGVASFQNSGRMVSGAAHIVGGYEGYLRSVQDAQKRGEQVYFIKRKPGIALAGGTIWIFNRTGELRKECVVIAGDLINGAHIDEDGAVYFACDTTRNYGDRFFLQDRGGIHGAKAGKGSRQPFTDTLAKAPPGKDCRILRARSPVKMEPLPNRPPDMMDIEFPGVFGEGGRAWMEGAEWMYAGASPMVSTGCSCPKQNFYLDWYRRCFVPEGYRHSIGAVDTAGNLILHIGRYGNHDSGFGPESRVPLGGDGIGMTLVRFISATDNYLAFEDHGERLTVLKLNYHAEQATPIGDVHK